MQRKHNKQLTGYAKELRKNMTKEEKKLWHDFLKTYPLRFLRQKVIDNYIADFYCSKARLVIELDGSQHYSVHGRIKDLIRTAQIESRGIMVMRIPNNLVMTNFNGVCEYIDKIVCDRNPPVSLSADSPL